MNEDVARYRYLGTTDECVKCQRCGRTELRSTVVLDVLDLDGNVEETTYFGSSCAAAALGIKGRGAATKVLDKAKAEHRRIADLACQARDMFAFYGIPEGGIVTTEQLLVAADRYANAHRDATWADDLDDDGWLECVMEMVASRRRDLVNARRLGLKGF